ncbi:calcium-binding protein [Frischella perrara]|uniref:calcium-binding protein n=1 Tax=Frischella perrara TaxID=1267021 RepID=UPI0023F1B42E|nr:calcium-binding protein [Frischella perrara]
MAGLTLAEAEKNLSGIKDAKGLRNLINQLDVSTHGSKTVLYSDIVNDTQSKNIIKKLRKDSNYRIIDNTEAAKFLNTAHQEGSPLNKKLRAIFGSNGKKLSNQAIEFLYGSQHNGARQNNGAWDVVANNFDKGAKGDVCVIGSMDSKSIFAQTELPALMKNPNVIRINGIDKSILKPLENNGLEHIRNAATMRDAIRNSTSNNKNWGKFKLNNNSLNKLKELYDNSDSPTRKSLQDTADLIANSPVNKLANKLPVIAYVWTGIGLAGAAAEIQTAMDRGDIDEAKAILLEWGAKEINGTLLSTLFETFSVGSSTTTVGEQSFVTASIGLGMGIGAGLLSDSIINYSTVLLIDNNRYGLIQFWDKLKGYFYDTAKPISGPIPTLYPSIPGAAKTAFSPIILDLDRDGIETISKNNNIHFDLNANQFAENTGWVGSDDGLLVLDLNNNGIIDNGRELFGEHTLLKDGSLAKNGYQALAEYDENGDGVIDKKDSIWQKLKVWQDKNSNGYTDENELISLEKAGISAISTKYSKSDYTDSNGNEYRLIGEITYTDGKKGQSTDVWFATNQANTIYTGDKHYIEGIENYPSIRGFGNLINLSYALSQNNKLKNLLDKFIANPITTDIQDVVDDIIFSWANVSQIDPNSRGIFDARKLSVLEIITGEKYTNIYYGDKTPPVEGYATDLLLAEYNKFKHYVTANLLAQTEFKQEFKLLKIDINDNKEPFIDFSQLENYLNSNKKTNAVRSLLLQEVIDGYLTYNSNDKYYQSIKDNLGQNTLLGDNFYLFGLSGHTTVEDTSGRDKLLFMNNIKAKDIIFSRQGANITVKSINGNSSITFKNVFKDAKSVKSGINNDNVIEEFVFANGTKLTWDEVLKDHLKMVGSNGKDTLLGSSGNDILSGGKGNDFLSGGEGDDTYIFNLGDGHDTIDNQGQFKYVGFWGEEKSDVDIIRFGKGIRADMLRSARKNKDLIISIDKKNSITIKNWFSTGNEQLIARVDYFEFADGSQLGVKEWFNSNPIIISGTEQDETLLSSNYGDIYKFGYNSGHDQVTELGGSDKLKFLDGITLKDVRFARDGGDILITLNANSASSFRIKDIFSSPQSAASKINSDNVIEKFVFADGTKLTWDEVLKDHLKMVGSNGKDTLLGSSGNDILSGGKGNDFLSGGEGDDTYIFNLGDGHDTIDNQGQFKYVGFWGEEKSDVDIIRFGKGIRADMLRSARKNKDLIISIDKKNSITIKNWFSTGNEQLIARVDYFEFADGSQLGVKEWFNSNPIIISGTEQDETLLSSNYGDIYKFGYNSGHDQVTELGGSDKLEFLDGITLNDVRFSRDGGDILITLNANSASSFRIKDIFSRAQSATSDINSDNVIEKFVFADGKKLTWDKVLKDHLKMVGTKRNDTLLGGSGNDILSGGKGNDFLSGGAGNDTYIFNLGDGHDTIDNQGRSGYSGLDRVKLDVDTIRFGKGIRADMLRTTKKNDDLIISIDENSSITIKNWFSTSTDTRLQSRIDVFQFNDGSSWLAEDINAHINDGIPLPVFSSKTSLSNFSLMTQNISAFVASEDDSDVVTGDLMLANPQPHFGSSAKI